MKFFRSGYPKKLFLLTILGMLWLGGLSLSAQDIYYVSPQGDDAHTGRSLQEPLRSIQTAVQRMSPGDTCYLREGVYREKVRITKSQLTLKAYQNEKPVVSGLDEVKGWTKFQNNIYRATFKPDDKQKDMKLPEHLDIDRQFLEVFAGDKLMTMGRWPNDPVDSILVFEKHGGQAKIFTGGKITFYGEDKPDFAPNQWTGAFFTGIMTKYFCDVQGVVSSNTQNMLTCSWTSNAWAESTDMRPVAYIMNRVEGRGEGIGRGFLTNHLNAVDVPGEWYFDKRTNELYFQAPDNADPNTLAVEAKSRRLAFDITNCQKVTLDGLYIKGAAVSIKNSSDCLINNCSITYPVAMYAHDGEFSWRTSLNIEGGARNKVTNSYLAHSWGGLISERNGQDNVIHNNYMEDLNWLGTYNAGVHLGGTGTQVTNNTITRSGRFLLYGAGIKQGVISHNDLSEGILLGQDAGAFYTNQADGDATEIAYNWIHDLPGVPQQRTTHPIKNAAIGIYLDGGSSNFYVHHNVIWDVNIPININPLQNKPSHDNRVEDNTCVANLDMSIRMGGLEKNSIRTQIHRNLVNKPLDVVADVKDNVVDVNGTLIPAYFRQMSEAAHAGTKVGQRLDKSSIKTKASMSKTPAGAYKPGEPVWEAGADLAQIDAKP